MSHDDFAQEPVPGLPADLPEGETLLWQGAPQWKSLAVRGYHVRKVAIYFALLIVWRVAVGIGESHSLGAILLSSAFIALLGAVCIGVLSVLAYFTARSTIYSITSARVLMRHGVAVPMTMNIPFKCIDGAALKAYRDGTGDIALSLAPQQRVGYLITWPHLRPGRYARPEPSLRGLQDAERAAEVLRSALAAATASTATASTATASTATATAATEPAMSVEAPSDGAAASAGSASTSARPRTAAAA